MGSRCRPHHPRGAVQRGALASRSPGVWAHHNHPVQGATPRPQSRGGGWGGEAAPFRLMPQCPSAGYSPWRHVGAALLFALAHEPRPMSRRTQQGPTVYQGWVTHSDQPEATCKPVATISCAPKDPPF